MNKYLKNLNSAYFIKNPSLTYKYLMDYLELKRDEIRFQKHPLGFKYWKLGSISQSIEFRLHYWTDTEENQDNQLQVHDHSFDFESFVVYGSIENITYSLTKSARASGYLYNVQFRNNESILLPKSENQFLQLKKAELFHTGEFYFVNSEELHESKNSQKFTLTLLKIIKPKNKIASVFSPKKLNNLPTFERTYLTNSKNKILITEVIEKANKGKSTVANKGNRCTSL